MSAPATMPRETIPRERPILFSAPMVRAILDGSKTQTRRPIGLSELRPSTTPGYDWTWRGAAPIRSIAQQQRYPGGCWQDVSAERLLALCPYGARGDRLWVRETWGLHAHCDFTDWHRGSLRGASADVLGEWALDYRADWRQDHEPNFWRPSIHMPRWASRIDLEVTSVRVERVNDISEADARAEGFPCADDFAHEWALIYGEAFRAWVWVVDFKRVRP